MSLPTGTTRADFSRWPLVEVLRDATCQYLEVRHLRVVALEGPEPPAEYDDCLLSKTDWNGSPFVPSRRVLRPARMAS